WDECRRGCSGAIATRTPGPLGQTSGALRVGSSNALGHASRRGRWAGDGCRLWPALRARGRQVLRIVMAAAYVPNTAAFALELDLNVFGQPAQHRMILKIGSAAPRSTPV